MRRYYLYAISFMIITGCSPINSVEPFDNQQAYILARQVYIAQQQSYRAALLLANRH